MIGVGPEQNYPDTRYPRHEISGNSPDPNLEATKICQKKYLIVQHPNLKEGYDLSIVHNYSISSFLKKI